MKKSIGIIVIGFLIMISMVFMYIYIPYLRKNSTFVIVNENTIWMKKNDKWKNVSKRHIVRFSYDKLYSFDGSSYIGETYNDYSKNLTIYNKNYEPIILKNQLLSIMSSEKPLSIKILQSATEADELDSINIDNVLNKYSIQSDYQMTKYLVDIDNDSNLDEIYNITNFYMNDNDSQVFSIVFSVINENIEIIDHVVVSKEEELKEKSININHVVDVDNDKQYEIILSRSSFGDVKNDCNSLYKYNTSKKIYEKIIGC